MSATALVNILVSTLVDRAKNMLFGCSSPAGCDRKLKATEAFVPDLAYLYRALRGTEVKQSEPLSVSEVGKHARCAFHTFNEGYRKELAAQGVTRMFGVLGTLGVMDRWVERNAAKIGNQVPHRDREAERRARIEAHRAGAGLSMVYASPALPEKPRPRHRDPRPERRKLALVRQAPRPEPEKKGRRKGGEQNQKGRHR